ncbi:hypothetical protein D3C74_368610 [compost metagenome]
MSCADRTIGNFGRIDDLIAKLLRSNTAISDFLAGNRSISYFVTRYRTVNQVLLRYRRFCKFRGNNGPVCNMNAGHCIILQCFTANRIRFQLGGIYRERSQFALRNSKFTQIIRVDVMSGMTRHLVLVQDLQPIPVCDLLFIDVLLVNVLLFYQSGRSHAANLKLLFGVILRLNFLTIRRYVVRLDFGFGL